MIFVTAAGSVLPFDILAKKIDKLVKNKIIKEKVVIQIGNGKYIPKNCEWFRFKDSLEEDIKKADLVISHSGAGTLFELIERNKKIICIINTKAVSNPDIVIKFSEEKHLLWCKKIENLESCIKNAKKFKPKKYIKPKCNIDKMIKEFLG